jgi:hypothetical protein
MSREPDGRFHDYIKCPRCEVKAIPVDPEDGPVCRSCTTRDDGTEVYICTECAEREIHMQLRGHLTPVAAWPLSIDELLEEDRIRYEFMRVATESRAASG